MKIFYINKFTSGIIRKRRKYISGIVPIKGQDFEVLEAAFGGKNKVTATIDNNKDGIYNYGKAGATI